MSENNKKYILITAALIVIGAALYFFYWMRTPQYTFTQIHEAVQQHDLTKFEKHVDLNSLYAHAYDDVVYYAFGDPKEANPFLLGIVQSLKTVVVPIMTEQTKHYVETGSIEDNTEEPVISTTLPQHQLLHLARKQKVSSWPSSLRNVPASARCATKVSKVASRSAKLPMLPSSCTINN